MVQHNYVFCAMALSMGVISLTWISGCRASPPSSNAVIVPALISKGATNDERAAQPFAASTWRVPVGFKTETIVFPLSFAPELPYVGVEEIRFSPGFFDPKAPAYFTYAFVWALRSPSPKTLTVDAQASSLTTYFSGLMDNVGREKQQSQARKTTVTAQPAKRRFAIATVDAFGVGAALDLVAESTIIPCGDDILVTFAVWPTTTEKSAEADTVRALAGEIGCTSFGLNATQATRQ
jgi:hypothetical protein